MGTVLTPRVVVGFDRSPESQRAVWWAADEAASRRQPLLIVHASAVPSEGWGHVHSPTGALESNRPDNGARLEITALLDECHRRHPELVTRSELRSGRPTRVLSDIAGPSDLLVLGSPRVSRSGRVLLGSTSAELARTSPAQVVLVRGERAETQDSGSATRFHHVVLGLDGSDTSRRALGFAYEFAYRHQAVLTALLAWSEDALDAIVPGPGRNLDHEEVTRSCQRVLANSLSEWKEQYPTVVVRSEVIPRERPSAALIAASQDADLLVVGTRGRGAVRAALLGSVSHAVASYALCPVAIAR